MSSKLNIGILGCGKVASIVICELLYLQKYTNCPFKLIKIAVRDKNKKRSIDIQKEIITDNVDDILNDHSVNIVIELIGKIFPAKHYIEKALEGGKHVITANRSIVSEYGEMLSNLAMQNNVHFLYEGTVGCGIPIIDYLCKSHLNNVDMIVSILNSTTNTILCKMQEKNYCFDNAKQFVIKNNFAEEDINEDILGIDAAEKLAIMATSLLKTQIRSSDIEVSALDPISHIDLPILKKIGYNIKQVALFKNNGQNSILLRVLPILVPLKHPISQVQNNNNFILLYSNKFGLLTFSGSGVHPGATANSVLFDLDKIYLMRAFYKKASVSVINNNTKKKYYIRLEVEKVELLDDLLRLLPRERIELINSDNKFVYFITQPLDNIYKKFLFNILNKNSNVHIETILEVLEI